MDGGCSPDHPKAPVVQAARLRLANLRPANPSNKCSAVPARACLRAAEFHLTYRRPQVRASAQELLMNNRLRVFMTMAGCAAVLVCFGSASALAQSKGYTAPRTPDGHADLQGIWEIQKSP